MRTDIIGVYTIQYPDEIVWLQDNNNILISSSYGSFSAELTISSPYKSIKITHNTPLDEIMFDLNEPLRYLYHEDTLTSQMSIWRIDINIITPSFSNSFGFDYRVYDGISFTTKTHGTSDIIYVYNAEELSNIMLYSPADGEAVIGGNTKPISSGVNQLDLSNIITNPGNYNLYLRSKLEYPPIANIIYDIALTPSSSDIYFKAQEQSDPGTLNGGSLMYHKQIFPMNHTIIYEEPCDNFPFAEIRYINTDGCYRYFGGKILEMTDSNDQKSYDKPDLLKYNTTPKYLNLSTEKIIKIGAEDILLGAEIEDIIYSSKLWIRDIKGDWMDCEIETHSIVQTGSEYSDVILEIKTHKA